MKSLVLLIIGIGIHISTYAPLSAQDINYHPICSHDQLKSGRASTNCIRESDYIQRRDRCHGINPDPCFAIHANSDGWKTVLYSKDKPPCASINCKVMPFRYATIEYKSDKLGQAERWQENQKEAILREIGNSNKTVVFIFVHGWHHNAYEQINKESEIQPGEPGPDTQDRNLYFFKRLLTLTRWELDRNNYKDHRLLGIYIGWNGGPPNAILNIGNRAQAADRVGNSLDFQQDIVEISNLLQAKSPSNRMLVVGHSFGGRILSRFLLKKMIEERSASPLGKKTLVATINPAIGADSFHQINKINSSSPHPLWINFTSKDDSATGYIYSIGSSYLSQALGIGGGLVDNNQTSGAGIAIGHFKPYWTHRLSICHYNNQDNLTNCSKNRSFVYNNCANSKPVFTRQYTHWFILPTDKEYNCRSFCNAWQISSKQCNDDGYFSMLNSGIDPVTGSTFMPTSNHFWNIITDTSVIGPNEDYSQISSINHNAFMQTNLMRFLIESLLRR